MNAAKTRQQIKRFLNGNYRRDVDAFCIYQWVDRCYFHGWWDLGIKVASSLPPNSLSQDYHKRLEYLLSECRNRFKGEFIEIKAGGEKSYSVPRLFWNVCENHGIRFSARPGGKFKLEYLGNRLISLGKIKTESCTLYLSGMNKDEMHQLLNTRGLGHLKGKIRPRRTTKYQRLRLTISWEDAAGVLPLYSELISLSNGKKKNKETTKRQGRRYSQRKRFWTDLLMKAKEKGTIHGNIKPGQYSWIGVGAGRRGLSFNYAVRRRETQVELYIDRGKKSEEVNKSMFDQLFESKETIEATFGGSLEWERLEKKRACRIRKLLSIGGYQDENGWPEIHEAAIDAMNRLEKALKPHIEKLII